MNAWHNKVGCCLAAVAALFAKTARAEEDALRIAHIADPQIGFVTSRISGRSEANFEQNYARDLAYVKAMIPLVNAEQPDLVLIAGDLMQNATDLADEWPTLLQQFTAPVLIAPGNHDMGNNVTAANLERFKTLFGSAWTSVSTNGYRVIVMNSQFWYATDGSAAANAAKAEHDVWLDAEIAAAKDAGEKIILCSHIPPFENTVNEDDSYFNCPKSKRTDFMDMLIANGVNYWLCGHTHTKTQHQYVNASGTLDIWTAEAVCENFDGTPSGFHVFEIRAGETAATWKDVPVTLPDNEPKGQGEEPAGEMSSDYRELEYIVADGNQYIDTGYKPNPNSRIYFKFAATDDEHSLRLFGCAEQYSSDSGSRLRAMRRKKVDAIKDGVCFVDMASSSDNCSTPAGMLDSEIHEIVASNDYKSYDGVEFGQGATKPLAKTINLNLHLLTFNNFGGGISFVGRVYAFRISEGDSVLMDLVPAMRELDGAVGLYDRKGGGFMENAGSGVFAAGPLKYPSVVRMKWRGRTLTVSGTAKKGDSVCLCWGATDGGDDISAWAHGQTVAEELPAGDFELEYKTKDFGIAKTDFVRAFIGSAMRIKLVEYVQTDGSKSYFDTGLKADATTAIALDGACLSKNLGCHFLGCCVSPDRIPSGQTALSLGFYVQGSGNFGCCQNDGNAMDSQTTGIAWNDNRHLFEHDVVARTASMDGVVKVNFSGTVSHGTIGPIYIGCRDDVVNETTTQPATPQQLRIWSVTTKRSGEVVQHLVPAIYRDKGCLYDTVTKTVLKSSGGGTVTCASSVTNTVASISPTDLSAENSAGATYVPSGTVVIFK